MLQYFETLTDDSGNSLLGATVTVQNYPAGTLASIYQTNGTALPVANSTVAADITGQVSFYVPDGAYILVYTYKSTVYKTKSPVQMIDPMGFVAGTDTGTANAYVVTDQRFPVSLYVGLRSTVQITHTNTAGSTYNLNTTGNQPVQTLGGTAVPANALLAGGIYTFEWTGTAWQLLYPPVSAATIGGLIFPQTSQELASGVTPTNFAFSSGPVRYGADPTGVACANTQIATMGSVSDVQNWQNGTYLICAKVGINGDFNWQGGGRTTCQWKANMPSIADYILEIGTNTGGPNVNGGSISKMYFYNAVANNKGILHLNAQAGLWGLDNLVFFYNGCPAIITDQGCSDMYYNNCDVYGGYTGGSNPVNASVQNLTGSNNIYYNNWHMEQMPSGAFYVAGQCGPIHIQGGKLDQGFIAQTGDGFNVQPFGQLYITNYQVTGIGGNVFAFNVSGSLYLSQVVISGGAGGVAHIADNRAWQQINGTTFPTYTASSYGPYVGTIDLGNTEGNYSNISVNGVVPAMVKSKIANYRFVNTCSVTAVGSPSGGQCQCTTNLPSAVNGTYNGCYLVYNTSGTVSGPQSATSRRLILQSFTGGVLTLQGGWAPATATDVTIEYCAGHYTPLLNADGITLDPSQTLFAIIATGATITSTPFYTASGSGGGNLGCTTIPMTIPGISVGTDLTGYYLVDDVTGEAFLIAYGLDGSGNLAVPYSRTSLTNSHTYSVVAGHYANAKQVGGNLVWNYAGQQQTAPVDAMYAAGFTATTLPIWGFGSYPQVRYAKAANQLSGNYTAVLSDANTEQIYNAGSAATFTIPANAAVPFPVGTHLDGGNVTGSAVTIAITTDSLYWYNGSSVVTGSRTMANGSSWTLKKVQPTAWILSGTQIT